MLSPLTLATTIDEKHTDPIKNISHCMTKSDLCTTLTTYCATEKMYYFTRAKHDCASDQCIFDLSISVTGHREGTAGFAQRNQLPSTTAVSCFSVSSDGMCGQYYSSITMDAV